MCGHPSRLRFRFRSKALKRGPAYAVCAAFGCRRAHTVRFARNIMSANAMRKMTTLARAHAALRAWARRPHEKATRPAHNCRRGLGASV